MKKGRLVLFSLLICFPAVLLIACWAYCITVWMPRKINIQQMSIGKFYRREAEDFIRHPEEMSGIRTNRVSQQVSTIRGVPWGRLHENGRDYVWYKAENGRGRPEWRLKEVNAPDEVPYGLMLYAGGGVVAVALIGLSLLATLYYVRLMRERDDFLAATAHDLTTPLVGMRMMIGRSDEEAKRLNERMILIVSNIKDFLRLGGKRRNPDLKPVDVVALCKEAYGLFAADYEDSEGGAVEFEVSQGRGETPPPQDEPEERNLLSFALADETMLLQILWNLFGNDLKYAAPYGKVTVRFAQEGDSVKIEFADEGQGMTPRQMKRAFDRYYRARTVLESGKGGFGIGLCTAREFARAMGGDLTVRVNEPKGCVFTLALPRSLDIPTGKYV